MRWRKEGYSAAPIITASEDTRKPSFRTPRRISPRDKYERGVGFVGEDAHEFSGICEFGANHLILCYGQLLPDYVELSRYDFYEMCSNCDHRLSDSTGPWGVSDPFKRNIFSAWFVLDFISQHTKQESDNPYYVYFITDGTNAVKIGVAKDVKKRLGSIQTGNPRKVSVLYLIKCDSEKEAYVIENGLHRIYSEYRLEGEWFLINDKIQHNDWKTLFSPEY